MKRVARTLRTEITFLDINAIGASGVDGIGRRIANVSRRNKRCESQHEMISGESDEKSYSASQESRLKAESRERDHEDTKFRKRIKTFLSNYFP